MKGSPLLQTALLALALAVAGVPVWLLTRPHEHARPMAAPAPADTEQDVEISLTATAPAEITLALAGATLWRSQAAGTAFSGRLRLPSGAVDLVATVNWPQADALQAVRIQVREDGETLADASLWGTGEITGVVGVARP